MFIKPFVFLLTFFLSNGMDSLCASAAAPDRLDDRSLPARMSVYLYPRTVADIAEFDLSPLNASPSAPVELIYWAVGFKRESDGTVRAYQKSHNPAQDREPFDITARIIHAMFERFSEANGYRHTWLLDTCLKKHAGLMDEGTERLLPSFNEGQRGPLVIDIISTFRALSEETKHTPHSVSVDIEPICQPDGSDSLFGFHAELVAAITDRLRVPVSVHMSCSKIHDWLIDASKRTAGSPAEGAFVEFGRLVGAIRMHHQSYLIVDAYCHGDSCEHQSKGACWTRDGSTESSDSCQWQHFTSCKKLQTIFSTFTGMKIPFKTALSISGSSSGGITPAGWNIGNFGRSLERIRSEGRGIDLRSPYLRGIALYGVGGERRKTGNLGNVLGALIDKGFIG